MVNNEMFLLTEHETDTAHRLSTHEGKCRNLHGHRYKFVIAVTTRGGIEHDDWLDFYRYKQLIRNTLDELFDHATMLCDNALNKELIELLQRSGMRLVLMEKEPTVEYMTEFVADKLRKIFGERLRSVTIYETPINYCRRDVRNA